MLQSTEHGTRYPTEVTGMVAGWSTQALNRLLSIQAKSMVQYMVYAEPWTPSRNEEAEAVIEQVVADQRQMADRISRLLLDRDQSVNSTSFPMAFTALHDLSMDYLLGRLIEQQRHDVAAIEDCVQALSGDPEGRALAEEALGAARAHLESLEGLAADQSPDA